MQISGYYKYTAFRDEKTSYTNFKFELYEPLKECPEEKVLFCSGYIPSELICMPLLLDGNLVFSEKYETPLFSFEKCKPYINHKSVAVDFLEENIYGLSAAGAEKVVSITGPDLFSFAEDPNAEKILAEWKFSKNKIQTILNGIKKYKVQQDLIEYLSPFGMDYYSIDKVYRTYGTKSIQMLEEDPYKVGYCAEMPFSVCDTIGKSQNIACDNSSRLFYLIFRTLKKINDEGHLFSEMMDLINKAENNNKKYSSYPAANIPLILYAETIIDNSAFVVDYIDDKTIVYLKNDFFNEKQVADNVRRINKQKDKYCLDIDALTKHIENTLHIKYADSQRECFDFLLSSGIKVITGGAGTGKTTVVNGILAAYKLAHPEGTIVLMAPTGRAAKRMTEVTGYPAGTIHRMLNIRPFADTFETDYKENYPADLLIVDEASMIDMSLMSLLLKSLRTKSTIIFIGDINQLPSVGPGNVLREMLRSDNCIENVFLKVNYRQGGKGTIVENAIKINGGKSDFAFDKSFLIKTFDTEEQIQNFAMQKFLELYNPRDLNSVQILCSVKKGLAGTRCMNKLIQDKVNDSDLIPIAFNTSFRLGDKIMMHRNNYEDGYFNGDVGEILNATADYVEVNSEGNIFQVARNNLSDMDLAYACTVHKSQGSEYDTVILILPKEPRIMLRRNLLYTAVTRAKKNLIIITQPNCLENAIECNFDKKRNSILSQRINRLWGF